MMKKNLLMTVIALSLVSCGLGNSTQNIYITAATTGQCNPMTSGSCAINLTYSTNGVANLAISYSATPQNQPAFGISTANCIPQGIYGTQTCTINVNYTPAACTPGNQNETVTFILENSQSNPVVLSCTY